MTKGLINAAGVLLALMLWGTAQAKTVHYYYTDPQGTPLAKADANGAITETFDYRPYGTQALGQAPSGPGYTGHVNDPGTGLVYMQARYYDPEVGRFLSVDPVGVVPADGYAFNRYAYASNNPISNIDPDGRESACVSESNHCNGPSPNSAAAGKAAGSALLGVIDAVANEWNGLFHSGTEEGEPIVPTDPAENAGLVVGTIAVGVVEAVVTDGESTERSAAQLESKLPKPPTGPGSVPRAERDPKRFFTPSEREAKRAEQGHKCAQCGSQVDASNSRGHHIKRHADGGQTTSENHAEVCANCHRDLHS